MINRQRGESLTDYEVRLYSNKDELNLTWKDIATLLNEEYGTNLSADTYRKRSYLSNRINDTEDECAFNDYQRSKDERTQLNATFRRVCREETIKEIAKEAALHMNLNKQLTINKNNVIINNKNNSDALLLISDWHYGIEIDNRFNVFNTQICKDRVQQLQDCVIDKCNRNNVKKLSIINLGDMIAGNIHLPLRINSQTDVITQIMEVSELLAELLTNLSSYYIIDYYSVLDNHSRIDPDKKEALQLESLARITEWYLKDRLANNANINIHTDNEFGPDIATLNIGKCKILAVHGDKDKPRNIIDRLNSFTQEHYNLLCSAHLHHYSCDENNETLHISNGALMGTDSFATDLRLNSIASQTLVMFDKDNNIDSIHKIDLQKRFY